MQPTPIAAVVGGGFYGCMLAERLARGGMKVTLLERESDLLLRASLANQARVHGGYHYPRSLLTGLRSRANLPRFVAEFPDCIERSFTKLYAIASRHSQVTARHFVGFCRRIGAPVEPAPPRFGRLFDRDLVEAVFTVEEFAFDATKLRRACRQRLAAAGVGVRLATEVTHIAPHPRGGLVVTARGPAGDHDLWVDRVFNCTYARLNTLLAAAGVAPIPLRHELAEMALVEMPEPLARLGVTVMCGPFFSAMPFPSRGVHSFSHVRYTPHTSWTDGPDGILDGHRSMGATARQSHFPLMLRDAVRYMPLLADCRQVDSLWEIKTVLPANDRDDGRPILLEHDVGLPGLSCVLAAKIDNVFDMLDAIPMADAPPLRRAA
jgi:glycine/D-amino acid oxidase-like deaminating enzyme